LYTRLTQLEEAEEGLLFSLSQLFGKREEVRSIVSKLLRLVAKLAEPLATLVQRLLSGIVASGVQGV